MRTLITLFVLLWSAVSWAADVSIVAPTGPVQPSALVVLRVVGLDDLSAVAAECTPAAGALLPVEIAGKPVLIFQGMIPGKYQIRLSQNAWAVDLESAVAKVTAAKPKPELLAKLTDATRELTKAYPPVNASCTVEVAGVPPLQPSDPEKPPPGKIDKVVYVYEKDQGHVPPPVTAALNKLNDGGSGDGILASPFEDDSTTGLNEVPRQYRIALERARKEGLPCLIVLAGDVVVKVVSNPTTEADVLGAVK